MIYPFRYIFIYNKKFTITGGVVSPRSEKLTLLELEKYERSLKLKPEFLKNFTYSALSTKRISPMKSLRISCFSKVANKGFLFVWPKKVFVFAKVFVSKDIR